MSGFQDLRPHEIATGAALAADATLAFIGRIETPWARREDCPRQGDPEAGPDCTVIVDPPWDGALAGIEAYPSLDILYWLHLSRRDLILQNPRHGDRAQGTFSLRSPVRPNPIGLSTVRLVRREGSRLIVRGLECVSGTPLLDIKPDRCHFTPRP
jgi:tRNA-Thr(GGU) m(6)t(6)A37 methyltransferase TsaA